MCLFFSYGALFVIRSSFFKRTFHRVQNHDYNNINIKHFGSVIYLANIIHIGALHIPKLVK